MTLYDSITETIGETPLVRLNRMNPPGTHVYVKIERGNPAGSIKDRAALSMINDAVARGELEEGGTIIEPTSGNTGIAIAMIAAARGYRAVIVMPDTMSKERISLMRAYGAEVVLSPGAQGMQGAVDTAERIRSERGGFIAGQFDNPANVAAHRVGTGKEILRDLPDVDFIYVEPTESPLITEGRAGAHNIQGIGSNFVPGNYLPDAVDSVETVATDDAIRTAVDLARKEGIFAGISSGANVFAALRKVREDPSAKVVAILPDGGEKYMSLGIYE